MSDSFDVGLTVAVLSMVGTLLALAIVACGIWALGRFLHDPEPADDSA
jgi:hypothetical protein